MKSGRMRWVEHLACMGEMVNVPKTVIVVPGKNIPFG
jgi:hypothetical protein